MSQLSFFFFFGGGAYLMSPIYCTAFFSLMTAADRHTVKMEIFDYFAMYS